MIEFSGLASGMDTSSIVAQLVELRRRPIYQLENKKTLYEQQTKAFAGLESRLSSLLDAIHDLDNNRDFASLTGISSDEDALTATAGSLASQGSYDITINTLAQAQKSMSQGFDSPTDSIGTGTFSITVGGETTDIALEAGASGLSDLASSINNSSAGVTATVLYDGSESGGYHLVITAEETGTDAAFTLDASGLGGGTSPNFTTTQEAGNAEFVIDTLPITSQSNEVANAIQGVTLNLAAADDTATHRLEIGVDGEALQEKMQAFVDAYNALTSFVEEQKGDDKPLRGDSLMRNVTERVRMAMTASMGASDISTLYQVGLRQEKDGVLSFDSALFEEKMAEDYSGVRDLFVGTDTSSGIVYMVGQAIEDMTDSVDGVFKLRTESLGDRIEQIDDRITRYERSIDKYESTLKAKFTAMEQMVSALQAQAGYLQF